MKRRMYWAIQKMQKKWYVLPQMTSSWSMYTYNKNNQTTFTRKHQLQIQVHSSPWLKMNGLKKSKKILSSKKWTWTYVYKIQKRTPLHTKKISKSRWEYLSKNKRLYECCCEKPFPQYPSFFKHTEGMEPNAMFDRRKRLYYKR